MNTKTKIKSVKLYASVYRDADLGDATNNGLSSRVKGGFVHYKEYRGDRKPFDAWGFNTTEARELCKDMTLTQIAGDFIIMDDMCCGVRRLRAIPAYILIQGNISSMFGGNFLWSGDSRFFEHPVKIHDRVE